MIGLFSDVTHLNDEMFVELSAIIAGRITIQEALPKVALFSTNSRVSKAIAVWRDEIGFAARDDFYGYSYQ